MSKDSSFLQQKPAKSRSYSEDAEEVQLQVTSYN